MTAQEFLDLKVGDKVCVIQDVTTNGVVIQGFEECRTGYLEPTVIVQWSKVNGNPCFNNNCGPLYPIAAKNVDRL